MKKVFLSLISLCFLAMAFGQTTVEITSDITKSTTWTADKIYVLKNVNFIYVKEGATLTIEPGTLIKGDPAALIITRGSKIIAQGTPEKPIVFTSNKPAGQRAAGDWGGVGILGKAKINNPAGEALLEGGLDPVLGLYGGTDDADNSGILQYVRIEFAGIAFQPNNEINSLTLGGVGSGTVIEHVQTSFGGDDAFEWFGGKVNGKYLIAYKTVDDMFDTDFGYGGKNQFIVGLSDPDIADVSGSNGFESDNDAQGTANEPRTNATFVNASIFGPRKDANTTINSNFRRGAHLRRCTDQDHYNSLLAGFPVGLRLESACSEDAFLTNGTLNLKNNFVAGCPKPLDSLNTKYASIFGKLAADANYVLGNVSDVKARDPYNAQRPDFRLEPSSPLAASANSAVYSDPFFTSVNYSGAFNTTDDWTACWAEWDPQNANYDFAPLNYVPVQPTIAFKNVNGEYEFSVEPAGFAATYDWNFGDGTTSTASNPKKSFLTGNYNISVTVSSQRGCSATATLSGFTGTQDIREIRDARLFPNPAGHVAYLQLLNSAPFSGQVILGDMTGRQLASWSQNFSSGSETVEIQTASLVPGLYLIRVQSDKGVRTLRLSVAH